jgi:starvation-inducible DNA-binding protein
VATPQSPIAPDSKEVATQLRPVLIDLIALALDGKQAHWHVRGRHFMSLHKQLDALVGLDYRTRRRTLAPRHTSLDDKSLDAQVRLGRVDP